MTSVHHELIALCQCTTPAAAERLARDVLGRSPEAQLAWLEGLVRAVCAHVPAAATMRDRYRATALAAAGLDAEIDREVMCFPCVADLLLGPPREARRPFATAVVFARFLAKTLAWFRPNLGDPIAELHNTTAVVAEALGTGVSPYHEPGLGWMHETWFVGVSGRRICVWGPEDAWGMVAPEAGVPVADAFADMMVSLGLGPASFRWIHEAAAGEA